MVEMREKDASGQFLQRIVKRGNKFHHMFGIGRGYDEYHGYTNEHQLPSAKTSNFSTKRFASRSFESFEKIYKDYEGLIRTFNNFR